MPLLAVYENDIIKSDIIRDMNGKLVCHNFEENTREHEHCVFTILYTLCLCSEINEECGSDLHNIFSNDL